MSADMCRNTFLCWGGGEAKGEPFKGQQVLEVFEKGRPLGSCVKYDAYILNKLMQKHITAENFLTGLDCITRHPLLEKLLEREVLEVMLSVIVEVTRGNSQTTPK